MRVISRKKLREFWQRHPDSRAELTKWFKIVESAKWQHFAEVRAVFSRADTVRVGSGNTVTIFDICGTNYRLVVKFHYNRQIAYILKCMGHEEYGRERWKGEL